MGAVTTDHFSSRAPDAAQHECCEPGAHSTLHGVVFAILCPGPAVHRPIARRVLRGDTIQLQAIMLQSYDSASISSSLRSPGPMVTGIGNEPTAPPIMPRLGP